MGGVAWAVFLAVIVVLLADFERATRIGRSTLFVLCGGVGIFDVIRGLSSFSDPLEVRTSVVLPAAEAQHAKSNMRAALTRLACGAGLLLTIWACVRFNLSAVLLVVLVQIYPLVASRENKTAT